MTTSTRTRTAAPHGYRLAAASAGLWRVLDSSGRVVGHVAEREEDGHLRIIARRFRAASRAFVDIGSFWRLDDAVAALHHSR